MPADTPKEGKMTHEMRLDPAPFAAIARGDKTLELRLYDEKRRAIAKGDLLLFTNRESGATLKTRVVDLFRFRDFAELYAMLPLSKCGYSPEEIPNASPADMEKYYPLAEQKKYGVVAIEISLI